MKVKKIFKSLIIAFALLVSAVGTVGIASPQKAEAFSIFKHKSGSFSNYVETKTYSEDYNKKIKRYHLIEGSVKSTSKGKGTYKFYIQKKSKGKGSWKTIKTFDAKKNGTSRFSSPWLNNGDTYRFKLVNKGSKKTVKYNISWAPFAS
ncbi:hypothetical protein [Bacillus atrophaeus]|uniref:hypothetical protein n=1 Tax=Bacillus atrophaeus TaxID=1452 RepID=UPI0022820BB2|nr:hypothetical protein [Bacillus atrophaeus]MCY8478037.1 hypothetical protein [Bacillus atrophaeus]MCY8825965.1 hypothetical protein [Bacillus atrophaeus]MCY8840337.1 hypothetical protein [Bacillus atrophaeus]MCY9166416.1 hypothetical protein [Bacillus atrophaeus]MEC0803486.1 hypothetical protein [Bacillus atrophaeus]